MERKNLFSVLWMTALAAIVVIAMLPSQLSATGTAAGTTITNTASVTFNDGSNVKNKTSNTLSMYVGHKVSAAFAPVSGQTTTTYDNSTFYYPIAITNTSNRATPFTVGFNTVSGYTLSLIDDADNDGTHDAGEETVVATTESIPVDGTKHYFIKAVVGTLADANVAAITVKFTNAAVDDGASHVVVVNPTANFDFTLTATINKPVIAYTVSGSAPAALIPGAAFSYTVSLDNTGSADPYRYEGSGVGGTVRFTYTIPANFAFAGGASGTYTLSPSSQTANYSVSGSVITFDVPVTALEKSLAAQTFTFPLTIDMTQNTGTGPAPGATVATAITDFGSLTYGNGQQALTLAPAAGAPSTIFNGSAVVAQSRGARLTVTPANGTAATGEEIEYIYTLKNMGNATATFTLSDAQNGGDFNTDHLIAEASRGTDLGASATSSVTPGQTLTFYVRVTVPAATNDQIIARTITVSSNASGTLFTGRVESDENHTVTTTVGASKFNITMAIVGVTGTGTAANPAPGDVIEYSITVENVSTTATVSSIVISNPIDTHTDFIPTGYSATSGIKIDDVTTSDNTSGVAYFNANSIKTTSAFNVAANSTKVIKYKVAVK